MKQVTKTAKIRLYPKQFQEKQINQTQYVLQCIYNIATELERYCDKHKSYLPKNFYWYGELKPYLPPNFLKTYNISAHAFNILCNSFRTRKDKIISERKKGKPAEYQFRSFFKQGPLSIGDSKLGIKIENGKISFSKMSGIKYLEKGYIDLDKKDICDSRYGKDKTGKFHAYLTYKEDIKPYPKTGKNCGIDIGLKDNITLVEEINGKIIKKPIFLSIPKFEKLEEKIKKLERKLSKSVERRKKVLNKKELKRIEWSNNLKRKRQEINKWKHKLTAKRHDWLHKITNQIVKNYDKIFMETLNVKGMTSSRKGTKEKPGKMVAQKKAFNKKFLEFSPYKFKEMIKYKCEFYGKVFIQAPRNYASTRICNECGHKNNKLPLKNRFLKCTNCGLNIQRDLNAGINLLKLKERNKKTA